MLDWLQRYLSQPLAARLLRTLPATDPWQRYPAVVPLSRYGQGADHAFRWYFEGESRVSVATIDEVLDWLRGCEYVRDLELFDEADLWQHPCHFETLRKGDCEDFSLWGWRKLVRLGYAAEFVAGHCTTPGHCPAGHTWIVFPDGDEQFLFDPVMRSRAEMIRPLAEVRHEYVPEVSVDDQLVRYVYAGYYLRRQGHTSVPEVRHAALGLQPATS